LAVLSKNGGVWMDASIICGQPLDINKGSDFFGYFMPSFTVDQRFPVIESWFFACTPDCSFTTAWFKEFMHLNDYETIDDYVEHVKEMGVNISGIGEMAGYLAVYVAAQKVMQLGDYGHDLSVADANQGPYKYLADVQWNSEVALRALCNMDELPPIVKMRGVERRVLEDD